MVKYQDKGVFWGCNRAARPKAILLVFLFFLPLAVLFAQTFPQQYQEIEKLQNRASYAEALELTNAILKKEDLTTEQKQQLLLSKVVSFYHQGNYDSMRVLQRNLEGSIDVYSFLYPNWLFAKALLSLEEGDYQSSIRDLKEAEVLFEERGQLPNLAKAYNTLGSNFRELEAYTQAKDYYKKGLRLHESLSDSLGMVTASNNLGVVYRAVGQLDSALFFYKRAAFLLERLNNTFLLAQNQLNIGNVYEQIGDLNQAETYFSNCLALSEKSGIQYGVLLSRLNLGNLFRLQKKFEKAKEWLNLALNQSREMGLPRERGYAVERLSWLARDTQNFEEAYLLSLEATKIKDSLLSESVKKESFALQERYESERKTNDILLLEAKNQRFVLLLVLGGIGLLVLVILVLSGMYRQKKLLNQKLLAEAGQRNLTKAMEAKDMELTAQALQILQIKKLLDQQGDEPEEEGVGLGSQRETFEFLQTELEHRVREANGDFYRKLLAVYPTLKPSELKLCSYLRLNLSTKELAEVLNKSVRTIENTRFSVRKKMGLGPEDNLVAQLIAVEEK